jgi:hypothetical protein
VRGAAFEIWRAKLKNKKINKKKMGRTELKN